MIEHTLDTANSILYVRPASSLEQADFVQLAKAVDPHLEATGGLAGLVIEARAFPGGDSLGAMAAHISAAIRQFPADDLETAKHWVRSSDRA